MLLGVIGDVHGAFEALDRVIALEPDIAAWLCVGDVASDAGEYPAPLRWFYFIKGNNENFDLLARLRPAGGPSDGVSPNLRFVPNGVLVNVLGAKVAGLGGTFAPTWYDTAPEDLPGASARASRRSDPRRHFVRAEVEACEALRGVDIFLSHEAPRPYWVGTGRGRNDAGKAAVNGVLAAMRPRLHFFGHHHRFSEATREGVPSIGLPLVSDGYVTLDTEDWRWEAKAVPA